MLIIMRPFLGYGNSLQRRHNGCDCVPNHQPHDCLLNRRFRRRSKKTTKLRVTGLCEGNSPVTGEFPAQRASNAENVAIWWRHHILQRSWNGGNTIPLCHTLQSSHECVCCIHFFISWWRHQMETFSALLALYAGNSPVTDEFPAQRPVTRSFDFSLICASINGWVNNREAGELRHNRAHYDVIVLIPYKFQFHIYQLRWSPFSPIPLFSLSFRTI